PPLPQPGDLAQRGLVKAVAVHQTPEWRSLTGAPGLQRGLLERIKFGQCHLGGKGFSLPAIAARRLIMAAVVHRIEQLAVSAVGAAVILWHLIKLHALPRRSPSGA